MYPNSATNDVTAAAVPPSQWSWSENKIFEDALVEFPPELPNRWQKIAGRLPGRSPADAMHHYQTLMLDVAAIDAGHVHLPNYPDDHHEARWSLPPLPSSSHRKSHCDRKKGRQWTVKEHLLFLKGLEVYGWSDWRSISRNIVTTRLPSQVASHAQKYYNRLKSKKTRKRSSIHDITTADYFAAAADDIDQLAYHNYGDNSASTSFEPQPLPSVPIKEEERLIRSFDGNVGGGGAAPMDGVQETDAAFMYKQFPSEFEFDDYGYEGLDQNQLR